MKKSIIIGALCAFMAFNVQAQPSFTEWHDMQVNDINRFTPHTSFFAFENESQALRGDMKVSSNYLSLEGKWRFHWVENADQRPVDCFGMARPAGDSTFRFGDFLHVSLGERPFCGIHRGQQDGGRV